MNPTDAFGNMLNMAQYLDTGTLPGVDDPAKFFTSVLNTATTNDQDFFGNVSQFTRVSDTAAGGPSVKLLSPNSGDESPNDGEKQGDKSTDSGNTLSILDVLKDNALYIVIAILILIALISATK